MTDQCPKCGAEYDVKHHDYDLVDRFKLLRTGLEYECASVFYSDGVEAESMTCLRRQLSQARELMREAANWISREHGVIGPQDKYNDLIARLRAAAEGENDVMS